MVAKRIQNTVRSSILGHRTTKAEAIVWRIAKILDDFAKEGKLWGIVGEFHKLKETVSTLQKVVRNAEKRSLESRGIKAWLDDLADASHDADDFAREWNVEVLRRELPSKDEKLKQVNTLFSPSNELALELKSIGKRIEAIAARGRFFDLLEYAKDVEVGRVWRDREQSDPFVNEEEIIWRNGAKSAISKFLLDSDTEEKFSVLSMWGMSGIGNTSLARCLYKDDMVDKHFDLRIWVCVGDLSDFKMVLQKIIESAATERADDVELEQSQNQLMEHIRGKMCLLVMDDVWLQFPQHRGSLKSLLMGVAEGSKILITAHDQSVAHFMRITSYFLENLSESSSLDLLMRMVCEEEEETKDSKKLTIARRIAKRCRGIPLAIRIIGRILYFKKTEAEWLHFEHEIPEISSESSYYGLTSHLKLSYDHSHPI